MVDSSHTPLFVDLARNAEQRFSVFDAQSLANMAWAFVKADFSDVLLFDALAMAAVQCFSEFNSQELANTAWVFATVES